MCEATAQRTLDDALRKLTSLVTRLGVAPRDPAHPPAFVAPTSICRGLGGLQHIHSIRAPSSRSVSRQETSSPTAVRVRGWPPSCLAIRYAPALAAAAAAAAAQVRQAHQVPIPVTNGRNLHHTSLQRKGLA